MQNVALVYAIATVLVALVGLVYLSVVRVIKRADQRLYLTLDALSEQLGNLGKIVLDSAPASGVSLELKERLESLERRTEQLNADFLSRSAQLSSRITRMGKTPEEIAPAGDDELVDLSLPVEEQLQLPLSLPSRKRARKRRRR